MWHAARYTLWGADIGARTLHPSSPGAGQAPSGADPWEDQAESRVRRWLLHTFRPVLVLDNHGYPAHEWAMPMRGYVVPGFEEWTLPMGIVLLGRWPSAREEAGRGVLAAIARRLHEHPPLALLSVEQRRIRQQHVRHTALQSLGSVGVVPARPEDAGDSPTSQGAPAPPPQAFLAAPGGPDCIVVLTEVPDETVSGAALDRCAEAHFQADVAALEWAASGGRGS